MNYDQTELYTLLKDIPHFGYWGELDKSRWGVTAISKHRDSDIITTVNFDKISEKLLKEHPEAFEIMGVSCSMVGWIDHLVVDTQNGDALDALSEVVVALSGYPIWDEEAVSEAECEAEGEDFDNNISKDLIKEWENDSDNLPVPEDAVWLGPKMIDQEERFWTTECGGKFLSEKEARDYWLEIKDPNDLLRAEFPETIYEDDNYSAYRDAMSASNQNWSEHESVMIEELYPHWREAILKILETKDE